MNIQLSLIAVILISMHEVLTADVMPELKKNVLNFGYGVNKLKVRKLLSKRDLLHVYIMLKQRKSWYDLESN